MKGGKSDRGTSDDASTMMSAKSSLAEMPSSSASATTMMSASTTTARSQSRKKHHVKTGCRGKADERLTPVIHEFQWYYYWLREVYGTGSFQVKVFVNFMLHEIIFDLFTFDIDTVPGSSDSSVTSAASTKRKTAEGKIQSKVSKLFCDRYDKVKKALKKTRTNSRITDEERTLVIKAREVCAMPVPPVVTAYACTPPMPWGPPHPSSSMIDAVDRQALRSFHQSVTCVRPSNECSDGKRTIDTEPALSMKRCAQPKKENVRLPKCATDSTSKPRTSNGMRALPTSLDGRRVNDCMSLDTRATKRGLAAQPLTNRCDHAVKTDSTITPTQNDVLVGRSIVCRKSDGRLFLQRLVEERFERYERADHPDKRAITREIVALIKAQSGRFLRQNQKTHQWEQLSDRCVTANVIEQFKMERHKRRANYQSTIIDQFKIEQNRQANYQSTIELSFTSVFRAMNIKLHDDNLRRIVDAFGDNIHGIKEFLALLNEDIEFVEGTLREYKLDSWLHQKRLRILYAWFEAVYEPAPDDKKPYLDRSGFVAFAKAQTKKHCKSVSRLWRVGGSFSPPTLSDSSKAESFPQKPDVSETDQNFCFDALDTASLLDLGSFSFESFDLEEAVATSCDLQEFNGITAEAASSVDNSIDDSRASVPDWVEQEDHHEFSDLSDASIRTDYLFCPKEVRRKEAVTRVTKAHRGIPGIVSTRSDSSSETIGTSAVTRMINEEILKTRRNENTENATQKQENSSRNFFRW